MNDLTEVESARLEKAMEDENVDSDSAYPTRTQSHFVELNSNNEDMLLEEIDDEERMNALLLEANDKIKETDAGAAANSKDDEICL